MADKTPNAWTLNHAKYRPHDRQIVRVAKGSWNAAADGTLDAGNGDTLDIVTVPANCLILGVTCQVVTAETANGTVDIGVSGTGITDDLDLWYDALNIASTGVKPNTGVGGTVFTGATTADVRVTATTDTADVDIDGAVFNVYVAYLELDSMKSTN